MALQQHTRVTEGKNDYTVYHKTYDDAMRRHMHAKKKGFEVDKNDIDFTLKLKDNPKKMFCPSVVVKRTRVAVQVLIWITQHVHHIGHGMSKSKKPRNKKMSAAKKQRLQQASDNNYGGLNF